MNWEQDLEVEGRLFKRDVRFLMDLNDRVLERVIREVKRLEHEAVSQPDEKCLEELFAKKD